MGNHGVAGVSQNAGVLVVLVTTDRRDVHAKGQGQRSNVKVIEVMTPFSRFRTVSPV